MSSHYQMCKKSIYRYREKNADKLKCLYIYKRDLKEFMSILLDDNEEKVPSYYEKNKEKVLEKKRLKYQKMKLEKV